VSRRVRLNHHLDHPDPSRPHHRSPPPDRVRRGAMTPPRPAAARQRREHASRPPRARVPRGGRVSSATTRTYGTVSYAGGRRQHVAPATEVGPMPEPRPFTVPELTVPDLPSGAVATVPDNVALDFLGAPTTYRELADEVDRAAALLSAAGVRAGDRVALVLPNCPQHVVAFYAVLRLGAVVA